MFTNRKTHSVTKRAAHGVCTAGAPHQLSSRADSSRETGRREASSPGVRKKGGWIFQNQAVAVAEVLQAWVKLNILEHRSPRVPGVTGARASPRLSDSRSSGPGPQDAVSEDGGLRCLCDHPGSLQCRSQHEEPREACAGAVRRLFDVACVFGGRMAFHPVRPADFGSWQGHGSHGLPSHVGAAGRGRCVEAAGRTCAEPTDTGHLRGCLCARSVSPEPALCVPPANEETHT